jgi:hypothetical protein
MEPLEQLQHLIADDDRLEGAISVERMPVHTSDECKAEDAADYCLARLGYVGIGNHWKQLTADTFREQLSDAFQVSLAYGAPMLPPRDADEIAARIVSLVGSGVIYWLGNGTRRGWTPVSTSTFDLCFVAVADAAAIVVIFEDED